MITQRLKKAKIKIAAPKCQLRQAVIEDVDQIHKVELSAWGCQGAASVDKIRSRINLYPEGQRVAVLEIEGREQIVGFVSTMLLTRSQVQTITTWSAMTSDGYITNHRPDGDHLYGVDLSVDKELGGQGLGNLLLAEIAAMVIRNAIRYVVLGGRLPGLRSFNQERKLLGEDPVTAADYANRRKPNGKILDSELRFYMGIMGMESLAILPGYFPDPESEDNGVLLRWSNPARRWFLLNGVL